MSTPELIVLGLALSMDAFAVTISNMFAYRDISRRRMLLMPLFFGVFQSIMPTIGYYAGTLVSTIISQYAGILTFAILGIIGGKMIWDTLHETEEQTDTADTHTLTIPILFFQAIATSIDALAVGVSFAALSVDVVYAVVLIGITTFLAICCALFIGRRFGNALGDTATIVGGIVLIIIGLKALL